VLRKVIELFYANTPNGRKISIMLEEIQYSYKVTLVNLKDGDQFNPKFRAISPFSKIPVITDHENNISIFESGAILIYLAERAESFMIRIIGFQLISGLLVKSLMLAHYWVNITSFITTPLAKVNGEKIVILKLLKLYTKT